jgi:hypothetical protein
MRERFHLDSPYTPEMVINGAVEFNGSDARRAADEIAKASIRNKAVPRLAWADRGVQIQIDGARVGDRVLPGAGGRQRFDGKRRREQWAPVASRSGVPRTPQSRQSAAWGSVLSADRPTGAGAAAAGDRVDAGRRRRDR